MRRHNGQAAPPMGRSRRSLPADAVARAIADGLAFQAFSLTLANSEQAYRPRGMRNIGSLSTIS